MLMIILAYTVFSVKSQSVEYLDGNFIMKLAGNNTARGGMFIQYVDANDKILNQTQLMTQDDLNSAVAKLRMELLGIIAQNVSNVEIIASVALIAENSNLLTEQSTRYIADSTLNVNLNIEIQRAVDAESSLQFNSLQLNQEVSSVVISASSATSSETVRATGVETLLSTALVSEIVRATGVESQTSSAVISEAIRAIGVEASLSNVVTAEVVRAAGVESNISQQNQLINSTLQTFRSNVLITNPLIVFQPSSIGSVQLWVHSQAGVVITSGGLISQWTDQSGNNNNFVQNTAANQPILISNGIAGLPSIQMLGGTLASSGDRMTMSASLSATTSIFYISQMTGVNRQRILSGFTNPVILGWHAGSCDKFLFQAIWVAGSAPYSLGPTAPLNVPVLYEAILTGSLTSVYRNGVLLNAVAGNHSAPPIGGLSLNGYVATTPLSDCWVSEILVYSIALNNVQRLKVENYFLTKYFGATLAVGVVYASAGSSISNPIPSCSSLLSLYASANRGNGIYWVTMASGPGPETILPQYCVVYSGDVQSLGGDGTSYLASGLSCRFFKEIFNQTISGLYYIAGVAGNGLPATVRTYCDMTRNGGGWTLLVTSVTQTFTMNNVLNRPCVNCQASDYLATDFSMLDYANQIKNHLVVSGLKMEYRLEATTAGNWGGIFDASRYNSFTSPVPVAVNCTTQFGPSGSGWLFGDTSIELYMPFLGGSAAQGLLTTSFLHSANFYGTIVANKPSISGPWSPAPWINTGTVKNLDPGKVWYWMREGPSSASSFMSYVGTSGFVGTSANNPGASCSAIWILNNGNIFTPSGLYYVKVGIVTVRQYCYMSAVGGLLVSGDGSLVSAIQPLSRTSTLSTH